MSGAELPFITIIIPVLNRADDLRECLDALAAQTYPADRFEIVVVDNGSTDATPTVATDHGARLLREPVRGPSHARNRAVRATRGELVAFIDSDCRAAPEWLEALARPFRDRPGLGFCGGPIEPDTLDTSLDRYIAGRHIMDQASCCRQTSFSFPFFMTANAMFSRQALDRVGLFDTTLKTGEDADLCWRVAWAGFDWQYVPEARVRHRHRRDLPAFARQVFGYGLGTVCLHKKHFRRFGVRWKMDYRRYRFALWFLVRLPFAWWVRDGDDRRWLLYETVDYWAFAAGRIYGSVTRRKMFL